MEYRGLRVKCEGVECRCCKGKFRG